MKNKLVFRILGALASALIIVSVFVPFVSVTGYSPSLWETYELTNSLYLPIMIIVFGSIGIIFFALNIKTEFAYMSVGAIAFFVVMQTIEILDQGVFNTLSIGYYFLVIGAFLTGLMAFLTNLKSKKRAQVVEDVKKEEPSMLDQIDKLYNEQTANQNEISPIQPVDNVVQPLPIQPIENVVPIQPVGPVVGQMVQETSVNPLVQNTVTVQEPVVEQVQVPNEQLPSNPVLQEFDMPSNVSTNQQPVVEVPVSQPVNPVLQEFGVPNTPVVEENPIVSEQPTNPVLQDFSQVTNPVLQEFGMPSNVSTNQQPAVEAPVNQPVNPVIQEFNNPVSTVQPQTNELDIFGQPINKS